MKIPFNQIFVLGIYILTSQSKFRGSWGAVNLAYDDILVGGWGVWQGGAFAIMVAVKLGIRTALQTFISLYCYKSKGFFGPKYSPLCVSLLTFYFLESFS